MRVPTRSHRALRRALVTPVAAALLLGACTGEPIESEGTDEAVDDAQPSDGASADADAAAEAELPTEPTSDVAATVGDTEITVAAVEERLGLTGDVPEEQRRGAERQLLGQLIQIEAVLQAAASELDIDASVTTDGPAVEAAVAERIEAAGGQEAFDAGAEAQGISPQDALALAEADAAVQVLVEAIQAELVAGLPDDAVDEEALKSEYDADPSAYQSSDVSHILFGPETPAAEGEELDYETYEAQAEDALQRLEDGEDFAALAMELSTGPSGPEGGALGVAPRGSYVQEFQDAVYADDTEPGEVVGPVRTEFGVHLILVNEITTQSFEEVLEEARIAAVEGDFQAFIEQAFADAAVEVDPYYGTWDAASSSIVVG